MGTLTDSLNRAIDRWNLGDLDGYLGLYAPSVRLHGYAPEPMDKSEVTQFYRMIWAALPAAGRVHPTLQIDETIETGATLACRFTMSGVHSGAFMNVAATGRPYMLPGITILHFVGDQAVERWSSTDMLGLLIQIGAVPPPG